MIVGGRPVGGGLDQRRHHAAVGALARAVHGGQGEHRELDRIDLAVSRQQIDRGTGDHAAQTTRFERLLLERQVARCRVSVQRGRRQRDDDLR